MCKKKSRKFKNYIIISLLILLLLLIIFGCLAPIIFTQCDSLVDFTNTGEIGDTIGGTMGPIVALAGVFMTFLAFFMQVEANKIQREQLGKSFEMRLLEDKIESRNALQLMSIDIDVMIKCIDLLCNKIKEIEEAEAEKIDEITFRYLPRQTVFRYTSINRNLVYNAFVNFVRPNNEKKEEEERYLKDFRNIYIIMDIYFKEIDNLYNRYKSYKDEILNTRNDISATFNVFFNNLKNTEKGVWGDALSQSWNEFKNKEQKCLKTNGILNILELHKTLEDKHFHSFYEADKDNYQNLLTLTSKFYSQNKMMIKNMCDVRDRIQSKKRLEIFKKIKVNIDNALSEHTIESIQEEFYKTV